MLGDMEEALGLWKDHAVKSEPVLVLQVMVGLFKRYTTRALARRHADTSLQTVLLERLATRVLVKILASLSLVIIHTLILVMVEKLHWESQAHAMHLVLVSSPLQMVGTLNSSKIVATPNKPAYILPLKPLLSKRKGRIQTESVSITVAVMNHKPVLNSCKIIQWTIFQLIVDSARRICSTEDLMF